MKRCNKCNEYKPLSEFNKKRKNGVQPYCKPCDRAASKARYHANKTGHIAAVALNNARYIERNRQYILEYLKSHPCVDCNTTDIRVLEFDHVDGDKIGDVSQMASTAMSLKKVQQEISKCEVRCANCHRIVTSERGGFWRSFIAQ